jgi:predicted TIM-barrel fold metal-dependent hydrolase
MSLFITSGKYTSELQIFSGLTIDVPSCFISGKSDWGIYRKPGDIERMGNSACTKMLSCHLVDLFLQYPQARFDLLHAGYPYMRELAALLRTNARDYFKLESRWAKRHPIKNKHN